MKLAQTDQGPQGGAGDGCVNARALVDAAVAPTWFDAPQSRMAQVNAEYSRAPVKNFSIVTRMDVQPAMSLMIEPFFNETVCYEQTIPPQPCPTGMCPPSFGKFGDFATPFTSVLGLYYENTSFVGATDEGDDEWKWTWVRPTLFPNGSTHNITRNFSYFLAPAKRGAPINTPRVLRRWEWTQGIPNLPPGNRLCTVIDFKEGYVAGAPDSSHFEAPRGVQCVSPGA